MRVGYLASRLKTAVAWLRGRLGRLLDDSLPIDVEGRDEGNRSGETSAEEAERRQLQLRMEILDKNSRGGFR